jgi:hypothetical protein
VVIMTLAVVLMVVLAVLAIVGALEVTRRAAVGRRMEESYDAMRPIEREPAPIVRPALPARRRLATRDVERRLEVPVRRAS